MPLKYVDAREYISVLRSLINEGKEVTFLVTGSSMTPFLINERDTVFLKKPDRDLQRGDIVFYQRENGQFVLHRIHKVHDEFLDMIGDGQTDIEYGVRKEQVFAIVYKVRRKGRLIEPGSFWWNFFAKIWIRIIPVRKLVSGLYSIISIFKKR